MYLVNRLDLNIFISITLFQSSSEPYKSNDIENEIKESFFET